MMAQPDLRNLDLYPFIRPFLFLMDPEKAHGLALSALKYGLGPHVANDIDPILHTQVAGLNFPNPIGLAAGFDKHAEVMGSVLRLGFGFTETGSITPQPQQGNPKPRLFRVVEAEAAINRFGFNSDGMEKGLQRLIAYHQASQGVSRGIVGINIGKNKETADAAVDYVLGVRTFAPYADYMTVNISSPNTPGLRNLQGRDQLGDLLQQVMAERSASVKQPPVFVKIAPDQTPEQMEDIAEVVLKSGVHGLIIGNTTLTRPAHIPANVANEAGGLSGKPLFELSTQVLKDMYRLTQGRIPLIGCGGVSSAADAYAKIRAGASLVQLYTAMIYEGPLLVSRIYSGLAELLRRDGFKSVSDAVGIDHR